MDIDKKKVITYMYPEVIDVNYINEHETGELTIEYQGIPLTIFNNNLVKLRLLKFLPVPIL